MGLRAFFYRESSSAVKLKNPHLIFAKGLLDETPFYPAGFEIKYPLNGILFCSTNVSTTRKKGLPHAVSILNISTR
jgi:hypothetical protein